jgi:hypothetical protein
VVAAGNDMSILQSIYMLDIRSDINYIISRHTHRGVDAP